jgi:hypothetical protein
MIKTWYSKGMELYLVLKLKKSHSEYYLLIASCNNRLQFTHGLSVLCSSVHRQVHLTETTIGVKNNSINQLYAISKLWQSRIVDQVLKSSAVILTLLQDGSRMTQIIKEYQSNQLSC